MWAPMLSRLFAGERPGKLQPDGRPTAFSLRFGHYVSPVLAGDGTNQEESQARAFDAKNIARRYPVEAREDPFQMQRSNPQAMIGNSQQHPRIAVECKMHFQLRPLGRILNRIIKNVEHRGAQILWIADYRQLLCGGVYRELDSGFLQVVALQGGTDALLNHVVEQ